MLWSSKREGQKDKVSTNAYKERSIALTLPSYTPSSIARITSGAILHGQMVEVCMCAVGRRGREKERKGEEEEGRRGGRRRGGRRLTRKKSQRREGEKEEMRRGGREKRREKAHQKGVPTKELAGALDDAEPKSA